MRVVIAGAGIAGLTAALSLHAAGIEALVADPARELRPLGVGINLLPHAVRELTDLGLAGQLAGTGEQPPACQPSSARPDWNRTGLLDDVMAWFADWKLGWLDVPGLIARAPEILEYPMADRDPLPWWGRGRATLIGDAAHPMYPIGSSGDSQAIIDARVLAARLATCDGDVPAALAAYEADRLAPTTAIVLANRDMPGDRVLAEVARRAPGGFTRIEDVMAPAELAALRDAYRRTSLQDAATLNARPPYLQ